MAELQRVLSELQLLGKGAQAVAGQQAANAHLREHLDGTIIALKAESKSVGYPQSWNCACIIRGTETKV